MRDSTRLFSEENRENWKVDEKKPKSEFMKGGREKKREL